MLETLRKEFTTPETEAELQRKGARTMTLKMRGWVSDGTFWRLGRYRMCVNNVMLIPNDLFRYSIIYPSRVWPGDNPYPYGT